MAKSQKLEFEVPPAGSHAARCFLIADLGTHHFAAYKKDVHKVMFGWELSEELMKNGNPFTVYRSYSLSLNMNPKNKKKTELREILESWLTKEFTSEEEKAGVPLEPLVGKACMITIKHNTSDGKTYANVAGVAAVPKGMAISELTREEIYYEIGGSEEAYQKLPEWIRKQIDSCIENNPTVDNEPLPDAPEGDESVPF